MSNKVQAGEVLVEQRRVLLWKATCFGLGHECRELSLFHVVRYLAVLDEGMAKTKTQQGVLFPQPLPFSLRQSIQVCNRGQPRPERGTLFW